jgi:hypothetical protein
MLSTARLALTAIIVVPALVFWLARGDADLDERVPARAGETLVVELELDGPFAWDRGNLAVEGHDGDEVRIEVDASGWGQYALDMQVEDTETGVEISGRLDGFLHWAFGGPEFEVRVRVPPGVAVEVRLDNAPVEFADLSGPITARVDSGDVSVERAAGNVTIRTTGSISTEDVEGDLALETERGRIRVQGVTGAVSAHTERGKIWMSSVDGPIEASSSLGAIHVERVRGDLRATTDRGRIQIEDVRGRVEADTDRARIEINGQEGEVYARSGRGRIDVEFAGNPSGLIVTDRGAIHVEVPRRAGFQLDASTLRGAVELDSDFAFLSGAPTRAPEDPVSASAAIALPSVGAAGAGASDRARRRSFREWGRDWRERWQQLEWNGPDPADFGWHHEPQPLREWSEHRGSREPDGADASDPWQAPEQSRNRGQEPDTEVGIVNGGGALIRLHSRHGSIRIDD